jgi:N-acetylglucosaminyldiphosphoundecaprenol N-acetyl-beta-D-mannosaminyltransferase
VADVAFSGVTPSPVRRILARVDVPRFNVLGVGVHAVNLSTATELLTAAAHDRRGGYVCCCDAHSLTQARRHSRHRQILNHAFLATPDGMPLVWAGRRAGHAHVDRTYGPDLMKALCAATAGTDLRHYFYGGDEGVADQLAEKMTQRFPGLKIAGSHSPPWAEDPTTLPTTDIRTTQPDFVWVGLSTPKQEAFMAHFQQQRPNGPICLGVGAAFDFLTGRVRQAPSSWQRAGFEWLWRLGQEPGRLARRYLFTVPSFALRLTAQRLGLVHYPLD